MRRQALSEASACGRAPHIVGLRKTWETNARPTHAFDLPQKLQRKQKQNLYCNAAVCLPHHHHYHLWMHLVAMPRLTSRGRGKGRGECRALNSIAYATFRCYKLQS